MNIILDYMGEELEMNLAHRAVIVDRLKSARFPLTLLSLATDVAKYEGMTGIPVPSEHKGWFIWQSVELIASELIETGQAERLPPSMPHTNPVISEISERLALSKPASIA